MTLKIILRMLMKENACFVIIGELICFIASISIILHGNQQEEM